MRLKRNWIVYQELPRDIRSTLAVAQADVPVLNCRFPNRFIVAGSRAHKHLGLSSDSRTPPFSQPHHQMWFPPHDMHMATPLPIQLLVNELQIVSDEELRQRE